MIRWNVLFLASLACALLTACSSFEKVPYLEPPDLMDQLANADLSASPPRNARRAHDAGLGGGEAGSDAETFPGDDRIVGQKLKSEGVAQGRNGYELNFNDAELSELAKVILRDTLAIPYAFDPQVQGRVTLSTGGPVSRDELLAILESVLAMHHGALIVEGKLYRIVPEGDGRQISSFDYVKERKEIGPGYGVSIFPLKYVSTETMMRMVESLSAKQEGVRASVHNNLLIVRGTSRERASLLDVVSMFDVDWMKGQSAGIFTLRNAAPDDVIKELHQVFQADSQGKGLVRFQPISRLNAILVLTQKSQMLDEVETWVTRLDRGSSEGENYYVYRVENGRAKDLASLLTKAFTGAGDAVRGAEESEVAPTEAALRTESSFGNGALRDSAPPTMGKHSPEAPADEHPVETEPDGGGSQSSAEVRVTPDERNNTLLIKASGRDLRKILGILRRIDQPPLQVLINATLAEVTLNDNLKYGVQFFLQKNHGKDGALGFTNGTEIDISPAVPGLNFIVGSVANPRVVLDALAAQTAVRVVSSPSVVVLHNQPATLQVGDEVPITTRQSTSVINPESPVVNEITYRNTGVILKVTPRINSNGLVTMEIEQEISAVTRSATSETLSPTISQRRISSTIAVQSGQMVVLGGLISEQGNRDKQRVPIVDKIPYLGDVLGGSTDIGKARTELVVFLRPSVIRDPKDASNLAEAVRAGMQSLAPRPAAWDAELQTSGLGSAK
jgi:general secretion pathway protein D